MSHEAGIAVIALDKLSVAQALAMDKYNSYDVEPDYIYKKAAQADEDISGEEIYDDEEGKTVPKEPVWGDWYSTGPEGDQYLNVSISRIPPLHIISICMKWYVPMQHGALPPEIPEYALQS